MKVQREPPPERILIVKLSAIGDVIQTLPMVEALKEYYPQALMDWVVEEEASDVLVGHPALNRVIVSRRKSWPKQFFQKGERWATIHEIQKFIRDLRYHRYDWIIDNHGIFKSGLLVLLSRGRRKIGYQARPGIADEGSYLFTNERYPALDIEKHALERYLDLVRQLGVPSKKGTFHYPVSAALRQKGEEILQKGGLFEGPRVVIHPLAKWATKNWPRKNFTQLADLLIQKGVSVIFTGSKEDQGIVEEIATQMESSPKMLNLSGQTSLKELAAVFSLADAILTTDTGPMHLAAAVGAPLIVLFGPTAPWRTGPYGDNHVVLRKNLDCSPCFRKQCATADCMNSITVEEVMKAVENRLFVGRKSKK